MSSWDKLKLLTTARVGLGRVGSSLPSKRVLEFQRAHATARSAVWLKWDYQLLQKNLEKIGESSTILHSCAENREAYLRFPNKGRTLTTHSKDSLVQISTTSSTDVSFVISDGLSALSIQNHFLPLWQEFIPLFREKFPELSYQLFLVSLGRVAIADAIGEPLKSQLSVIFIGERPGLNSPDSLGIYMTFKPLGGNSDAQRNCISNIRMPHGLNYAHAAIKLIYLMTESLRLQLSGVNLKDDLILNALDERSSL